MSLKKGKLSIVKMQDTNVNVPKLSVRKQDKKIIWLTCQNGMQAFKLQLGDVLPKQVENLDRGRCCKMNGWRKLCDQMALQLIDTQQHFVISKWAQSKIESAHH